MTATALTMAGVVIIVLGVFSFRRGSGGSGLVAGGNLVIGIGDMAARNWIFAAISIALAAICALTWRRRRQAPRAYGAKSLAALAAVVARMRRSLKPRHVLRPVRGGAR